MSTTLSRADRSGFHTIKEAAWILGVDSSKISRAIRTGALPAVRRRSQLVVPAAALQRLLGGAP
jgi:excisionase family DNA binding protein